MANARFSAVEQAAEAPDYARYDRVWQRVAPTMDPYPQVRAQRQREEAPAQEIGSAAAQDTAEVRRELMLPGAEENPCCLGTEAQDMAAVVEGFAREEAADGASFCQLARQAPNRMQCAALRELGQSAERRGRELMAIFYLIGGEQRKFAPAAVILPRLPYRELLRQRYHDAACNALNYARAADGTADVCLQRMLARFSGESYLDAERVLKLLAQLL